MKIKWGMMMTDGRGKLGGQVASRNRAGAYVRTKVTPVNPRTAAQMAVRYAFAVISKAWSGLLTETERKSWNESANSGDWNKTDIFGDAKRPSGKNLFSSINRGMLELNLGITAKVPPKAEFPEIEISDLSLDLTSGATFTGSLPDVAGKAGYVVYATPPLSQGTSYFNNQLRKVLILPAGTNPQNYLETNFATEYSALFGVPAVDDNIHYGVKTIINGQMSPLVTARVLVKDDGQP